MAPYLEILLLEAGLCGLAVLSSYLTWGPLTSLEMVELFGPRVSASATLAERRRTGMVSEMMRVVVIAFSSSLALLFYVDQVPLMTVLTNPWFRWAALAGTGIAVLWCVYLGPRAFALNHSGSYHPLTRQHFRTYLRPYLAWVLHPVALWAGIGLITLFMIVMNITVDLDGLQRLRLMFSSTTVQTVADLQLASLYLVEFGGRIALVSQKYVVTTLMAAVYVFLEQRSTMRETIFENSIERLKTGVWLGLIFTIGFSAIWLPGQYEDMYVGLRRALEVLTPATTQAEEIGLLITVQAYLEAHDIRWLLLTIATGYGNLTTLAIISGVVFVWRVFFKDVPIRAILQLFLPRYLIQAIASLAGSFRIDLDVTKDKPFH